MLSSAAIRAIADHIARYVGDPGEVLHDLIPQDLHIDIHLVSPSKNRDCFTLVTSGMSQREMAVPKDASGLKYAELMMCFPSRWDLSALEEIENEHNWAVTWLQQLARFPHLANTFLARGHTIPNGDPPEPVGPGTKMCCMLIREPATVPEAFRVLKVRKKEIHFHAVVPIYEDEMRYKLEKGAAALEELLNKHNVTELLDINRPSVIPKDNR